MAVSKHKEEFRKPQLFPFNHFNAEEKSSLGMAYQKKFQKCLKSKDVSLGNYRRRVHKITAIAGASAGEQDYREEDPKYQARKDF